MKKIIHLNRVLSTSGHKPSIVIYLDLYHPGEDLHLDEI